MRMEITEYSFNKGLNLKFAFVTDLHNFNPDVVLNAVLDAKVDALLLGGDILFGKRDTRQGEGFITAASKTLPTFYALGNHEAAYIGDIREKIKSLGAHLLDNDFVNFKGVNIGGITSGSFYYSTNFRPNPDFLTEFCAEKGFKLLICHHPEYYNKYIKDFPVDLTLSGHAHGGQWRFFGRGVFAPGQGLLPKYTSGLYDGRLLLSRGLGNLYPIPKINNKPQILIINL